MSYGLPQKVYNLGLLSVSYKLTSALSGVCYVNDLRILSVVLAINFRINGASLTNWPT